MEGGACWPTTRKRRRRRVEKKKEKEKKKKKKKKKEEEEEEVGSLFLGRRSGGIVAAGPFWALDSSLRFSCSSCRWGVGQ